MIDNSIILEDISTLTKMCNAKSDGPTLKIEENEIKNKISEYEQEIEEIKTIDVDESYDTSAEMADRNIEIISKKTIQATNTEIKNKTAELDSYKEEEAELSNTLHSLKRTKTSYEKYISSLRERLTSSSDAEISDRYNNLISETESKIIKQEERISEIQEKYDLLQNNINELLDELNKLESKLSIKKTLLAEAQSNLENKEVYIDKVKKEKSEKRIAELEKKIKALNDRTEEIYKDPKYLELKIKEILISDKDNYDIRNYIIELLNKASKVPYMDIYPDKKLEEQLLNATRERDEFAALIDSKSYDLMETLSPEQIRVDFLNTRIAFWQNELSKLQEKVNNIDKDVNFHYTDREAQIDSLLVKLKSEVQEFKEEYEKESDSNLSNKAILKVAYEEKKSDLDAAEEIASKFRKNEAEDAEEAGRIIKQDIAKVNSKIRSAEDEILDIKERLTNRKSGMKDISAKNKDRDKLSELAQVVIDIKHRRLFADRAFDVAKRLEDNLNIKLIDAVYTPEEKEILSKTPRPVVEETPTAEEPSEEQELVQVEEVVPVEVTNEGVEITPENGEGIAENTIIPEDNQEIVVEETQPIEETTVDMIEDSTPSGYTVSGDETTEPINEEIIPVEETTSDNIISDQPLEDAEIPADIIIPEKPVQETPAIAIAEPSSDDNYTFNTDEMSIQDNEEDNLQETTELTFEDSFPSVVQVDNKPVEEINDNSVTPIDLNTLDEPNKGE